MVASDVTLEVRPEEAEAFVGRLFEATVGAWELLAAHLGLQLGLYAALSQSPEGMTTTAVAEVTGVHPRYVQEWLEQQVISGVVEVDDPSAPVEARLFTLPPAHAQVLLDEQSPFYAAPLAAWTAAVPALLPRLTEVYRTGGGVRPPTMRRYAEEAGFSRTTELPIEDGFHKYYRLDAQD